MTSRERLAIVLCGVGLAMAAWLSAKDAPPLRMRPEEYLYLREAKSGVCVKLMLESGHDRTIEAWIVPDTECAP